MSEAATKYVFISMSTKPKHEQPLKTEGGKQRGEHASTCYCNNKAQDSLQP